MKYLTNDCLWKAGIVKSPELALDPTQLGAEPVSLAEKFSSFSEFTETHSVEKSTCSGGNETYGMSQR